jgi:hypothetical protein
MQISQLSPALRTAIESLFSDPSRAFGVLGIRVDGVPDDWYDSDAAPALPVSEHINQLKAELEEYIVSMAEEAREMASPPVTEAFCDQAIGLLLAVREIYKRFPGSDPSIDRE